MIKENIKIFKSYYTLVNENKKKLIPYYVGYCLNILIGLLIPFFVAKITENITQSVLAGTFVAIITFGLLKCISSFLSCINKNVYTFFFKNNYITLCKKIVKRIYQFDKQDKLKFNNGKIINTITTDIVNIGEMADNFLTVILNTISIIIMFCYFGYINIFIMIFVLLINYIYIKISNDLNILSVKYLKEQRKVNDELIGLINQTLQGLKDVQTLDMAYSLNKKYSNLYKLWKNSYSKKRKYQVSKKTILDLFLGISKTIIYIILAILIFKNILTIGKMLIIISYFDKIFSSTESIMDSLTSIKEENVSLNRLNEILSLKRQIKNQHFKMNNIKGRIEFSDVSFSYIPNVQVLTHLSFIAEPNQITVIKGFNGTGKSTIINLLTKLYEPNEGTILLDQQNILEVDKAYYLKQISILNQETYLFNFSVRDNFNLINKDKKEQEKVCKLLGIEKLIRALPKGFDTVISENSSSLSGGQKKLLSLARTLLKDSKILIFDEATSSLDSEMTKIFIDVLKKLKKNHTILIVSHKKDVIDIADKIVSLD